MDNIIDENLKVWAIHHVRAEAEMYMGEDKQKEAVKNIVASVLEQTTPTILEQIGIGYNVDTKEAYTKIVTQRTILAILNFSIKQNTRDMDLNMFPNSIFDN